MRFGRYKNFNWDAAQRRRFERAQRLIELRGPAVIIAMNFRLYLEAYHRGPWRMVWALFKEELHGFWIWYGFLKWEWIRVHIFRLRPNEDIAMAERLDEEEAALNELAKQL